MKDPQTIHLPWPVTIADRMHTRIKGLLFKKNLEREGLWITPCNSIHMLFMKFPIDVIMLDREMRVVRTVEGLEPWKIIPPVKEAYSTVELPVGTIKSFNIKLGVKLDFKTVKKGIKAS